MNIEALRALVYTSKYRNFRVVADLLHISQPAISKRIRVLEDHFGKPLVERVGASMVLTPAGQTVLPYAERIVSTFDEAGQRLNDPAEWQGTIRLGAVDTILMTWLTDFLDAHRRRYPKVRIEVTSSPTLSLLQELQAGRIDIAMMLGPSFDRALIEVPLCIMDVAFFIAGNGRAPDPVPRRLTREEIADTTLITFPQGSRPYLEVVEKVRRLDVPTPPSISGTVSMFTMRSMIERGLGIGTLPLPMAAGTQLQRVDLGIELSPLSFSASYEPAASAPIHGLTCALAAQTAARHAAIPGSGTRLPPEI